MDLTLTRKQYRADGIFGELSDADGKTLFVTLEHAYEQQDGTFVPKIPTGTFVCQRGPHRLHGMTSDFTTFEITGVEGHSNILFHWGNFNKDSEGCILLGKTVANTGADEMVTSSRAAFADFMAMQEGLDTFTLTVA